MGPQQFYLEISFNSFNMCTDLHMVELSESTNGNKSVDLITNRSMQYIYTLQGDPEQIIEKLNDRSHTMEQAVKGNISSSTSSQSTMLVGSHCMFHDKIIYLPKSINICFLNNNRTFVYTVFDRYQQYSVHRI